MAGEAAVTAAPAGAAVPSATPAPAQGETTPTEAPAKAAAKQQEWWDREFEGKANGKPWKYRPKSEAEFYQFVSKGHAADERFREASERAKRAEAVEAALKSGDLDVLRQYGLDPDEVAIERTKRLMEREQLPEHERRARDAEERAAKLERQIKEREEAESRAKQEAQSREWAQQTWNDLAQAVEAIGYADRKFAEQRLLPRVIDVYTDAAKKGYDLTPERAAKIAQSQLRSEAAAIIGGLDGDALLDHLGPQVVDRVRKAILAKHKKSQVAAAPPPEIAPPPADEPVKPMDFKEQRNLRREVLFGRVR